MSDIRWEGFSHEEIYAAVQQGPGRSVSTAAEAAWAATEALILSIDERIATAMARSAGGWEGSAADASRTAMTPLGQWALDAANDAKITAQAVTSQGEQARELRNAMPEPNAAQLDAEYERALTDPTYIFHGLDDLQAAEQESANRAARAVDLMNGYTNNSYENRRHMDYWTLPPQVTVEAAGPAPAPAGGAAGFGGGGFGGGAGALAAAEIAPAGAPAVAGGVPAVPTVGAAAPSGIGAGAPLPGAGAGASGSVGSGVVPPPIVPPAGGIPVRPPSGQGGAGRIGVGPPGDRSIGGGGRVPVTPGVRPVLPGPTPRPGTQPSWRDLVPARPGSEPGAARPSPRVEEERRVPPPAGSRTLSETTGRGPVAERPAAAAEPGARTGAAGRGTTTGHPGLYPPMTAGPVAGSGQERRRPDYLVDDTDAFADDRWFTTAVIGADDPLPPR
ncbi:PPE domain-containing protein [Pseudonocardia alaniniphila]|uniref:PPE domain-containing protein n=1 Tax=Pseudonocardia alaniniphila TaxID=75291 RepID=A0ABS9TJ15_9PSEU|nr:hypothetical protein [Pseudonocardia alaniniphila]MCH6168506.1 hypothetical protein [Pseudonocardia alaniniphila]